MRLRPEEKTILQDSTGVLTLTTHRVRLEAKSAGQSKVLSITLDAVASCGLITKSYPGLLVLAVLVAVLGYATSRALSASYSEALYIGAAVLVLAYFGTRSAVLSVGSASESITVPTGSLSRDKLVEFIDAVDDAKLAFIHHEL